MKFLRKSKETLPPFTKKYYFSYEKNGYFM